MVSYGLFVQLLIQLLLQELELSPRLCQLHLELCYFLGMFPFLNPSIKNKKAWNHSTLTPPQSVVG